MLDTSVVPVPSGAFNDTFVDVSGPQITMTNSLPLPPLFGTALSPGLNPALLPVRVSRFPFLRCCCADSDCCNVAVQNFVLRLRMGSAMTKGHMGVRVRGASSDYYSFDWVEGTAGGSIASCGSNCPSQIQMRDPFRRMRVIRAVNGNAVVLKEILVGCEWPHSFALAFEIADACLFVCLFQTTTPAYMTFRWTCTKHTRSLVWTPLCSL